MVGNGPTDGGDEWESTSFRSSPVHYQFRECTIEGGCRDASGLKLGGCRRRGVQI